jgi:hypothetical protein
VSRSFLARGKKRTKTHFASLIQRHVTLYSSLKLGTCYVPTVTRGNAMRLLYFAAHQMWPLTSGSRLRDYHQARSLAKRASVTFAEMCHPGEQPISPSGDCGFEAVISLNKGVGHIPGRIVRGVLGPKPLSVLNYFQHRLASQLSNILAQERFSTVQVEGVHLSGYLPVIQSAPNHPAIVVDWHNIESELMWRYSENTSIWPKRILARRTATWSQPDTRGEVLASNKFSRPPA